jgi:pimeloyl-ACP methyl ester carboxylesterase
MLSCTGRRNTAPDTPIVAVTVEISNPAVKPWSDAGDGYQQAYATVPYDYAHPRGKTFRLKLVRLPAADPAHRIGSLFINFGGPGAPAAVTVRQIGKFLLPPQVLARYELVGVDPRGTGESQPVRCTASTREQLTFPYATAAKFPVTDAEQAEATRQVHRYATQCRARNGDLLDHVGTLPFARDLDVLRAALGDRQINYYGLSYGTFLGQVLANTFPTRTGALSTGGRRRSEPWSPRRGCPGGRGNGSGRRPSGRPSP